MVEWFKESNVKTTPAIDWSCFDPDFFTDDVGVASTSGIATNKESKRRRPVTNESQNDYLKRPKLDDIDSESVDEGHILELIAFNIYDGSVPNWEFPDIGITDINKLEHETGFYSGPNLKTLENKQPLRSNRATDLKTCWRSAHITSYISRKVNGDFPFKPVVRCLQSRQHQYELPENVFATFGSDLSSSNIENSHLHTTGLFFDYGDYDILAAVLFCQEHSESSVIEGNKKRIFFEMNITCHEDDNVGWGVIEKFLLGYFDMMASCKFHTAHFRVVDLEMQTWACKVILDGVDDGVLLKLTSTKKDKDLTVLHFNEWLSNLNLRRNIRKMPFFEWDSGLPMIMENNISKRRRRGKLDINQLWLSVNCSLKTTDAESFVVGLSHNVEDSIWFSGCTCNVCKLESDCRCRQETSVFDSAAAFEEEFPFEQAFTNHQQAMDSTVKILNYL